MLRERAGRTVENLAALRRFIGSVRHLVIGATGVLESCEPEEPLDPEGTFKATLETAEGIIEEVAEDMGGWLGADAETGRGEASCEKPVARACSLTAAALRRLHGATVRLRWAILEHDANLTGASFRS